MPDDFSDMIPDGESSTVEGVEPEISDSTEQVETGTTDALAEKDRLIDDQRRQIEAYRKLFEDTSRDVVPTGDTQEPAVDNLVETLTNSIVEAFEAKDVNGFAKKIATVLAEAKTENQRLRTELKQKENYQKTEKTLRESFNERHPDLAEVDTEEIIYVGNRVFQKDPVLRASNDRIAQYDAIADELRKRNFGKSGTQATQKVAGSLPLKPVGRTQVSRNEPDIEENEVKSEFFEMLGNKKR